MQETMIDYKQNIYQELSRLTKGLGSEKRLDILNKYRGEGKELVLDETLTKIAAVRAKQLYNNFEYS